MIPGAAHNTTNVSICQTSLHVKRRRVSRSSPKAAAMLGCSRVGWPSPGGRSGLVKSRLFSLLYLTLRLVSLEKLILRVQQAL